MLVNQSKPIVPARASTDVKDTELALLGGGAPARPAEPRRGLISGEGRLSLGKIEISVEKVSNDLHRFTKLCVALKHFFKTGECLQSFIERGVPNLPENSAPLPQSLDALRDLFADGNMEGRAFRWRRLLDSAAGARVLSEGELEDLREVLSKATLITTAVCAIDRGVLAAPQPLLSGIIKVMKAYLKVSLTDADRYQREVPFDEYEPYSLRLELDRWAQRIQLGEDGSPFIRVVCKAEHSAARVLLNAHLERVARIQESRLLVSVSVRQPSDDWVSFAAELTIPHLYSILMLAQSATRLINEINRDEVDLVRMCRVASRGAGMSMQGRLRAITDTTLSRFDDLSEWAPRFETGATSALSEQEGADLAILLIDAEALLYVMDTLKDVLAQPWSQRWWRSKWSDAISDRDVKAALRLMQLKGALLECDFAMTADLARSGSLALGYSPEDRIGSAWRVPENQVHSLAWIFSRGAPDLATMVLRS